MTLSEKQRLFAFKLRKLFDWLHAHGYEVTLGEATRSNEQAEINALGTEGRAALRMLLRQNPKFHRLEQMLADNVGSGIRNSLHEIRLAIDLNLWKGGVYLQQNEQYKEAAEFWESLGDGCASGYYFGDGNHFSIEHEGRK